MGQSFIPAGYAPHLSLYETQSAISLIKRVFQDALSRELNLRRVSAPLFVEPSSGLNDDLNGVERPVGFDIPCAHANAQVVHSLAKWKRMALYRYDIHPGKGIYTDMNAIRRDEELDNLHSVYVDQWDWEKVITPEARTLFTLHQAVTDIVSCICDTQLTVRGKYPQLCDTPLLRRRVTFVTAQELEDLYPDLTPKQRENAFTKKHGTVFIQGIGAIINIILDPIMIFGLLGCPAMGVRGAAYATIIGQLVAAVLGIVLNQKHNTDVRVNLKKIRFNFPLIGEIYSIGFPSILMTAIGSVTTYLMNQILLAFSTTASAVYGVYFKLNSFFFMPLFGLNNAVVPIVAYNYGARNRGRIHQAIRTSTITAVTIMLLGWAAFFFLPVPLLRLFDASEAMIAIGIPAFRITSFTYPLAAVSIVASSVFQALGKSIYSMLVSLGRQLIVLIPVAYLFSLTGVLDDVWLAFPIAEVVCLISSLFFLKKVLHRLDDFPQ